MVFLVVFFTFHLGFPVGSDGKESTCNAGDTDSILRSVRFPWRREWLCIPIFLPGEFHGQRSLVGYNPWAHKGSNTTEGLTLTFFPCVIYLCLQHLLTPDLNPEVLLFRTKMQIPLHVM